MSAVASSDKTIAADDHRHGLYAMSPISLIVLVGVCGLAYFLFTLLQVTSTQQTILGLLQSGLQINPNATGAQVQQYMNGQLDHNQVIAAGVGWSVQIALLMISFPPDAAFLLMHKRHNTVISSSLARHAEATAKWRTFLTWVLIIFDVLCDFLYVAQGHMLFVMDGWHPSITGAGAGVLLVGLIYPAGVCFVTIFVGKYLFAFLDALIYKFRGTK